MKSDLFAKTKRICLRAMVGLSLLMGLTGCSLLYPPPSSYPDYDNSSGFILDYAVGDQFVTLKTMFLCDQPHLLDKTSFFLSEPGMATPSLKMYDENPEKYKKSNFIIRKIMPGTQIEIIAIKDGGREGGHLTYVKLAGVDKWVGVALGTYSDTGRGRQYNREYFNKIE
jgi:hypothetical protein